MAFAAAPAIAEAAPAVLGASEGAVASGAAARAGSAKAGQSAASKAGGSKTLETVGEAGLLNAGGGGTKKSSSPSSKGRKSTGKTGKSTGAKLIGKVGNRKSLLAELVVCMVILLLGSFVRDSSKDKDGTSTVVRLMVKGSALLAVFFILSILSTGGKGAQKVSGAIGLLVTMVYVLNSSDATNLIKWVKKFFQPGAEKAKKKKSSSDKGSTEKSSDETNTDTGTPPADNQPPSMEV